jgi:hypothetical protein
LLLGSTRIAPTFSPRIAPRISRIAPRMSRIGPRMSRSGPRIRPEMSFMTYIYIKKAAKQNGEGLVDGFHDGNFVIV